MKLEKEIIDQEIERAYEAIRLEKDKIELLRSQLGALDHPDLKVNDVVVTTLGERYVISRFDRFWPVGKKILKDGSIGKQERNLYHHRDYTKE